MELYGFMEREKKIPSYFFIITKSLDTYLKLVELVYDNLGHDTVVKWFKEYPVKYSKKRILELRK